MIEITFRGVFEYKYHEERAESSSLYWYLNRYHNYPSPAPLIRDEAYYNLLAHRTRICAWIIPKS
jgi:hypothetical protein